jgi:hypothetical protein
LVSNSNELAACGSKSIKLTLKAGGFYYIVGTAVNIPTIDTSVYQNFEFSVFSSNGPISLSVSFNDNNNVLIGKTTTTEKNVINYKIDNTQWSRVKIKLSDLGFKSQQPVMGFYITLTDQSSYQTFYVGKY